MSQVDTTLLDAILAEARRLRPFHTPHLARIRATGVPMNAGDDVPPETPPEEKPPWGSDEDFKPEKAWALIQNLRKDKTNLTSERDELRTKVKEFEDAGRSDQEKLNERASGAETRATNAEREAARLRVALKKGLTETQAKRLVGDDEEALEKDADELLADFKSDNNDETGVEVGQEPGLRPQEKLRPGAAPGATPEKDDPASLAEQVPRGY